MDDHGSSCAFGREMVGMHVNRRSILLDSSAERNAVQRVSSKQGEETGYAWQW